MEKQLNCYFDHSATTPLDLAISEWIKRTQGEIYGNPSSSHAVGRKAKNILELARKQMAEVLGCHSKEIIFTGSGTETNNSVLHSLLFQEKKHVVTSAIEHPAILSTLQHLEPLGLSYSIAGVDSRGKVNLSEIEKLIQTDTGLITIMTANNEVGTIQPISECSDLAKAHNIPFHSDAVQALGKISIQILLEQVDLMSFSAHKFYGPKGVGCLYKKENTNLHSFVYGGGQESNLRGGTENIIGIGAMALAAQLAVEQIKETTDHIKVLEYQFITGIKTIRDDIVFHGNSKSHIPGLISFAAPGMDNQKLLTLLDRENIFVSSGSACHSGLSTPSKILEAMDISESLNLSTIRVSFGKHNTDKEVQYFLSVLKKIWMG